MVPLNRGSLAYILMAVLLVFPSPSVAKVVTGYLETHKDWYFLTRFCFLSLDGRIVIDVSYPEDFANQSILFYFDDKTSWGEAYKTQKTCSEKLSVLDRKNNQIMDLNPIHGYCNKSTEMASSSTSLNVSMINCHIPLSFKLTRERWWYIAVSNCASKRGLRLNYTLTMSNNITSWLYHFSADEFYVLHVDLVFFVLYLLMVLCSCYQSYALYSRHLFHATYKLYLASVILEFSGLAFLCGYYGEYAANGFAHESLKFLGRALVATSSLVFLLLLVLLAKGYTVTRARLKPSTSAKIAVFMSLYVVIYAILFFYEQQFFDPGEVLYTYESPVGYGLIALRFVALGWFTYAIWHTARMFPAKRSFFIILFIMYFVWFISLPIVILFATLVIPKYMREKVVNGVDLTVALRAHFFFMILTWPGKFNRIFPYHVRTTQINAMVKAGQAGDSTLDRFSHYSYAPSEEPRRGSVLQPRRVSVSRQAIEMTISHSNGFNNGYLTNQRSLPEIG